MLLDESSKTKRSPKEHTNAEECVPFTIGDEATKTFSSPGTTGLYAKNISCVRVLEGE